MGHLSPASATWARGLGTLSPGPGSHHGARSGPHRGFWGDSRGPKLPWKEEGDNSEARLTSGDSDAALPAHAPGTGLSVCKPECIFSCVLGPVAGREFLKRSLRKEITESSHSPAGEGSVRGHAPHLRVGKFLWPPVGGGLCVPPGALRTVVIVTTLRLGLCLSESAL